MEIKSIPSLAITWTFWEIYASIGLYQIGWISPEISSDTQEVLPGLAATVGQPLPGGIGVPRLDLVVYGRYVEVASLAVSVGNRDVGENAVGPLPVLVRNEDVADEVAGPLAVLLGYTVIGDTTG